MGPGFSQKNVVGRRETESDTEPGCKAGCREKLIKTNQKGMSKAWDQVFQGEYSLSCRFSKTGFVKP